MPIIIIIIKQIKQENRIKKDGKRKRGTNIKHFGKIKEGQKPTWKRWKSERRTVKPICGSKFTTKKIKRTGNGIS